MGRKIITIFMAAVVGFSLTAVANTPKAEVSVAECAPTKTFNIWKGTWETKPWHPPLICHETTQYVRVW